MDSFEEAKDYMSKREIPQLFESLMTGLMYNKPEDHIEFLESCLTKAKAQEKIKWNTFLGPLPPIPQQDRPIQSEHCSSNSKPGTPRTPDDKSGLAKAQQPLPPIKRTSSVTPTAVGDEGRATTPLAGEKKEDEPKKDEPEKAEEVIVTESEPHASADEAKSDDNNNTETKEVVENDNSITETRSTIVEEQKVQTDEEKTAIQQPVIFVLGGPGSGKGTQCAKIVEEYKFLHLSAGDLLRQEKNKPDGSQYSELISECIKEGKLVPQEITIQLLKDAMLSNKDSKGFLIDGFPREIDQGVEFEEKVCKSTALLMFTCDDDILVARLLERGKTSGRTDDNEDTIKLRLKTFHEKTEPVAKHYEAKLKSVDASRTVDEIYKDVQVIMEEIMKEADSFMQFDEILANMEAAKANQPEEEEEETTEAPISDNYPKIEDTIVPVDVEICGDKGNPDAVVEPEGTGQDEDVQDENANGVVEEPIKPTEGPITGDKGNPDAQIEVEETVTATEEVPLGDIGNVDSVFKESIEGKKIIYVIGSPGAGKSTQCKLLAEKLGLCHVAMDQLLRQKDTDESSKERNPVNWLKEAIISGDPSTPGYLIEGFPRDVKEGENFAAEARECDLVLHLDCPLDEAVKRQQAEGEAESDPVNMEEFLLGLQKERESVAAHYDSIGKLATVSASGNREKVLEDLLDVLQNRLEVAAESATMSKDLVDANIIFVLGGPGSGKGTQCAKIVEKYGFCHLSTGDLLRDEVESKSERAMKLKEIMERGELVSREIILELLKEAMIKRKDCKGFLIDGFPRDVPQGDLFEKTVGTCKFVLYFDCSNEVMVERLLGRAKTSGRVDDNEETIKKRLKTFENQTLPVLEKYAPQDKVRKINAERDVDAIFADVCSALDKL